MTTKGGKSYFHFPDGMRSSALALKYYPSLPKRVRLLNTGKDLPFARDLLPEFFTESGLAIAFLHISGIPVDDLSNEAIVIEVEW